MDQPWRIEMLGRLRAAQPNRVISHFRSRKVGALLAYLAYYPDRAHPREQLIELLWPESPRAAGQRNLRTELASLRRQLEPPGVPRGAILIANRATVQLNSAGCITDVALFEAALKAAERAPGAVERVERLITAAEQYGGELLPGCYEDWIFPERQRLAEAFLGALHGLVALLAEQGDRPRALQWARRAVAADPLREQSHEDLIRLLIAAGEIEAAHAQYEHGQQLLERDLGASLSPEIHSLIKELAPSKDGPPRDPAGQRPKRRRNRASSQIPGGLTAGAEPNLPFARDGATTPALLPPGEGTRPNDNLPLRFTRFFGREDEIERLCQLLSSPPAAPEAESTRRKKEEAPESPDSRPVLLRDLCVSSAAGAASCRLLTLTGPGGTGKSRLALQVAERLRRSMSRGVWFVPLQELTDPALIPDQILLALRMPRVHEREALEQVVALLSETPALLILDNFEHLVEGGGEIVRHLLEQAAPVTVLVTSRRCLGLEGEREFPVGPLPVQVASNRYPVVSDGVVDQSELATGYWLLATVPSVALFLDRAQAVRPDFQVTAQNAGAVADLCQRLEGLPLAIELAAARTRVLTPQQMLERLAQRFELLVSRQRAADARHRSLRATLDWSYQLLPPDLQQFFARLSVFRGGWTAAAAEAVCGESRALECLEQLRECSLVQATETAGEMRFQLLETLREYGAEQLEERDRSTVAQRHAQFFLALAGAAAAELTGTGQGHWLDRLEREHDNLRAALTWSVESGEPEAGLRLGGSLQEFWYARGYLKEGYGQLLRLLGQPGAAAGTAERAKALSGAGRFAGSQGDLDTARALHEESLAIWRGLEDRAGIAASLRYLGDAAFHQWDLATSRALLEESLAICRELGDQRGVAQSLHSMGWAASGQWDLVAARAMIAESLAIWRELDDRGGIVNALDSLGTMALFHGDDDAARPLFEECLARATELGDKTHVAWSLMHLGWVASRQDEHAAARALYEQSLVIWRDLGDNAGLHNTLYDLAAAIRAQGDYPAAHAVSAEALAIARRWRSNRAIAHSLADLGTAAGDLSDWEQSAAHFTESLRVSREGQLCDHLAVERCFNGLARVALVQAKPVRAARLLGAAEALHATCSFSQWPGDRREWDQFVSAVRAQLPEAEYGAAFAEGQAMPLDQAIRVALDEREIPSTGGDHS